MSILNFAIYSLALSLIFSAIPLLIPMLGWDWIAVNTCAFLLIVGAIAISRTLWHKYQVRLFWLWLGFIGAVVMSYGSNIFRYFLR